MQVLYILLLACGIVTALSVGDFFRTAIETVASSNTGEEATLLSSFDDLLHANRLDEIGKKYTHYILNPDIRPFTAPEYGQIAEYYRIVSGVRREWREYISVAISLDEEDFEITTRLEQVLGLATEGSKPLSTEVASRKLFKHYTAGLARTRISELWKNIISSHSEFKNALENVMVVRTAISLRPEDSLHTESEVN